MRRRDLLALLGGGVAAAIDGAAAGAAVPVASLGEAASRRGIAFGSSFDVDALDSPGYLDLLRQQARILTTDHSLKFGDLRGRGPKADFSAADRLVGFAADEEIPIRGHALIWNENLPYWLAKLSADRRTYWFDRHIDEVAGRYAGRLHSWDVVNEAIWPDHGHKGGLRGGPWYDALGEGYVVRAFRRAAAVDPKAKLVLNEAVTETDTPLGRSMRAGLLRLVDVLKDAGVRLDAVGLQGHIRPDQPFDPDGWRRHLADLAQRDVEIYVTELDVDDRIFVGSDAERDRGVAETYRRVLEVALAEPRVTTVITWQLADGFSFYRDIYGPTCRPLPFDRDLRPKPAHAAMLAAFRAPRPR